ncbi:putative DNA primase/helicase [Pasteurella langaaensis DSM 22999]|uniref:Putative DNA primase/helicase n=1 Tax=Alitibacter langaaensis DSM 22999 TaxID=1122935 RepID=A0A2U0SMU2_9PAST|nr:phage/plasmid primase, P4 family [Pasteurella langaaensis]PVX32650.1 putative DNA primase/helicase [Pasteurella langaaensis DSM 22999]
MKFTNAPFLKEPWNKQHYSDLIVLVGADAWNVWGKGDSVHWRLLVDGLKIDTFTTSTGKRINPYDQAPVIIAGDTLENIPKTRIADKEQSAIKFIQCGELTSNQKTELCLNIAKNTNAKIVSLLSSELDLLDNWSSHIQRLRTEDDTRVLAEMSVDTPKIKEKDPTNEKSRAFQKWLGLDMALQRGSREIYAYNGQIWNKLENDDLEESAVKFLDESELGYSDNTIDRLINTLKAQLPRMGETSSDLIAFDNGVLNRNTLEFEPHNRQNWLTAYIPHNYDEQATNTPHFDKWLAFVSDGNKDKARNILAVLYAILTNRYNWQMFFEITGKGGSGKSVFASIATLLAGDKNTASSKLENFDDERGLAGLENKMLIICAEQAKYGGDGGGLKAISGGDTVRVRYNYKDPFNTKITALVMLINNEPCRFTERSGGINRRRVIFDFKKSVPEDERDPHFMDKITLEVGGIIRKVLDTFSEPTDAKKALMAQMNSQEALEVKKLSDPLTDFFGYFYTTEQMNGLFIGVANMGLDRIRTHLYPAYLAYTRAMNISELGLRNFVTGIEQALKQHGNEYDFIKKSTKTGVRTNVHYKDFDNFRNEVSN